MLMLKYMIIIKLAKYKVAFFCAPKTKGPMVTSVCMWLQGRSQWLQLCPTSPSSYAKTSKTCTNKEGIFDKKNTSEGSTQTSALAFDWSFKILFQIHTCISGWNGGRISRRQDQHDGEICWWQVRHRLLRDNGCVWAAPISPLRFSSFMDCFTNEPDLIFQASTQWTRK